MSKDYAVHWLLGVLCSIIWFWGERIGIPQAAVSLAATVVPGLLGHALSFTPDTPDVPVIPIQADLSAIPSQQPKE